MSLRIRIFVLVLIATMLPAIMLGVHRLNQRDVQREKAENALQALATYAAVSLGDATNGTVQLLHGLSRAPEFDGNSAGCSLFLKDVLERLPQYTGILTINPDGQLNCDSLATKRKLDLNDRDYFKRAKNSTEPVFEAVFGRLTGHAVLQVAYPMRGAGGNLKGVLLASLDLSQFGRRIASASSLTDLEMRIWDDSGTLLVRLPDSGPVKLVGNQYRESPLYRFVRTDFTDRVSDFPGTDRTMKTWAHSGLPSAGAGGVWMALGVPRDSLLAEANTQLRQELMYVAAVSLVTFLVALIFAELAIRQQLARIIRSAKRQGAGKLSERIGGPFPRGELGALMKTLDATAASVESQHAQLRLQSIELRKSNRTLRLLGAIATTSASEPSREALLTDVCRIALEEGGFSVAWVAMLDRVTMQHDAIAWRGADRAFVDAEILATIGTSASPSTAGPTRPPEAASIGTAAASISAGVIKRGAQTLAMFPLLVEGRQAGWLALYADAPDAFDAGEMQLLGQLARDVGVALELIEKSARLQYVARFDALTGLANGTLFNNRLRGILANPEGHARDMAVVLVDIVSFGSVNETWGRPVGDTLLQRVAARLSRHVVDSHALARMDGDHFAVVFADEVTRDAIAGRLDRLNRAVFESPYLLPDGEAVLAARYGVAVYPHDGEDVETLFHSAETAAKNAKASDNHVCFYDAAMAALRAESLTLEQDVRKALDRDELALQYEPKAELVTRKIVGVEAQVLWNSPERGLLPPAQFMALLENTSLVAEVGMWALQRAARDHGTWVRAGHRPPRIAVNVSPLQLRQRGFLDRLGLAIREDVTPSGIDLEITEALVTEDVDAMIVKLQEIRALGLNIAIDSIGIGYSSLAHLTKLPVQMLKIDRSFIERMLDDRDAMTMVSTMISLAHALRLKVVALGVEIEEQAKLLHLLACDQMQGALAGPPLSADELADTL